MIFIFIYNHLKMINFKRYKEPVIDIQFEIEAGMTEEIIFKTSGNYSFKLNAYGDCCSRSYFIIKDDINKILNKTIENIKEVRLPDNFEIEENEEEQRFFNDCITPHLYEISFKDTNETYQLFMYNYSNGYYDGWIEGEVI